MIDWVRMSEQIGQVPGVLAWYALGSGVRDQLRTDSDIDLAAMPELGTRLDSIELQRRAGRWSVLWNREVDVGVMDERHLIYAKEALMTGRLIWTKDEKAARKRGSELLSLYLTLQDDRREVLDAYRAR